jgi:hypothetical protein
MKKIIQTILILLIAIGCVPIKPSQTEAVLVFNRLTPGGDHLARLYMECLALRPDLVIITWSRPDSDVERFSEQVNATLFTIAKQCPVITATIPALVRDDSTAVGACNLAIKSAAEKTGALVIDLNKYTTILQADPADLLAALAAEMIILDDRHPRRVVCFGDAFAPGKNFSTGNYPDALKKLIADN